MKRLPGDASLVAVERSVADAIRRSCRDFNQRRPEVIVIAHEMDPRYCCILAAGNEQGFVEQAGLSLSRLLSRLLLQFS